MYVPIEKMNPNSRVWVYTSNRGFIENEVQALTNKLTDFTQNWLSHGKEVKASFAILHNQFLVLIADEKEGITGGCSIDSSFSCIKDLEKEFKITLFNRQLLTFLIDNRITQATLSELKIKQNLINSKETKVFFNTLVQNLNQLQNDFLIDPQQSWIGGYFLKE